MFFEKVGDIFIGRFAQLFSMNIQHGFSTRTGGVSHFPYNSLNLGFNTEDQPFNVTKNRKKFFNVVGVSEDNAAVPVQIHGNRVRVITEPGKYPETDGLITSVSQVVLTIQTADCVPVFLFDPVNKVIGLVHAGWQGVYKGIIIKTIHAMVENFNLKTENIMVFLGPSIGPCCYKAGSEVLDKFLSKYIHNGYLDLWSCLYDQLLETGCVSENIHISELCTACNPEWFFSYRRDKGKTGRMLGYIYL